MPRTYPAVAVSRKLGISTTKLRKLYNAGAILASRRNDRYRVEYDSAYIDYLAEKIAFYSAEAHEYDTTFFVLCTLQWQYVSVPEHLTIRKRKEYHEQVKARCEEVVASGKALALDDLEELIGKRYSTLSKWGRKGVAPFIPIGRKTYVSRRYTNLLISVFTKWQTPIEAAARSGVSAYTIRERIGKGTVSARLCQDGEFRIDPAVVATLATPTADESGERLVTIAEMAERLNVRQGTVRHQMHMGSIRTVGKFKNVRIPESEVVKWEEYFNNLNTPFAWLQPLIAQPGKKPQTLTTYEGARLLSISQDKLSLWCRKGVVPFFPKSFTMHGSEMRDIVRLYVYGLRKFAGEGAVAFATAVRYFELCREKKCII